MENDKYYRLTSIESRVYSSNGDLFMTLDDIRKELERDTRIDDAALDAESLRIPQLHNKYLNFLMEERLCLARYENDAAVTLRDKWEHYTGKMSEEELLS